MRRGRGTLYSINEKIASGLQRLQLQPPAPARLWQPGYLSKARGFASLSRDNFALLRGAYLPKYEPV
jgi:hypothetical protein